MTFISYAQNFEDVMLWRALKHVPNGHYIDVGAQDPVVDSVSKAFYEHGGRGVHVEPVPEYADLLRRDRPDEPVLQLALAAEAGMLELNVIPNTGLSTGIKAYAHSHETEHGFSHHLIRVPMLPMKVALAAEAGKEIHWLKIDVEGFEEEVLRGWDSQALRPWIIVIEATVPLSTEQHYEGADRLLTDAGYQFIYFDGLNRFYVASEHPELISSLQTPPNVFDEVHLSGTSGGWCTGLLARHARELEQEQAKVSATLRQLEHVQAQATEEAAQVQALFLQASARSEQFETRATRAEMRASTAEDHAARLEAHVASARENLAKSENLNRAANAHVQAMLDSTSWRVTAPLRTIGTAAAHRQTILAALKRHVRGGLREIAQYMVRRPALKRHATRLINQVPGLKRGLKNIIAPPFAPIAVEASLTNEHHLSPHPLALSQLSDDARIIYGQLLCHDIIEGKG